MVKNANFRVFAYIVRDYKSAAERNSLLSSVASLTINDLPNHLMHSQPRMYADDTSITYASNDVKEIERCVNIDLDRIRIRYVLQRTNLH